MKQSKAPGGIEVCGISGDPILRETTVEPCSVVILGVTGDLCRRKLMPAIYNVARQGRLPDSFAMVGCARSVKSDDDLRVRLRQACEEHSRTQPLDESTWASLESGIRSVAGDFDDEDLYRDLLATLQRVEAEKGIPGNRLFYLATPAAVFPKIIKHLGRSGLIHDPDKGNPWSRVIIEKPFGRDLASAQELNGVAARVLSESQTYRIDHYLGKETVQNVFVFRFGNALFEPLWNRKYVSHVEITAAETLGIESRGAFYDATGVVRDFVQNHLLQVLALIAMEAPVSLKADDLRDAKVQVLRSLRPIDAGNLTENAVFGQYRGYLEEEGVAAGSRTPTYVALRAHIDNWRWQGVPFFIRAGKNLKERRTEVSIFFQSVPNFLFRQSDACQILEQNVLTLRLQPDEGIRLGFISKVPGENLSVAGVKMDMSYASAFGTDVSDAYERLLLDCIRGDPALFTRKDGVERAWEYITPILEAWEASSATPATYLPGEAGPEEARQLIARDGHRWTAFG